ncbi:MAG: hypothetical protein HY361_00380 [Candidatus Aenigmarchaeota archaeon]|nr:hypothetical protein [Candidatus Aenigmarchaeota archaeon]
MKAISPLIAVVLLVGFTVALGGIVITWLSTLASTQTTIVSSGTEKQVKCAASSLAVIEVRYPSGAGNGFVNVTVRYESGTEILSNITAEVGARGSLQANTSTGTVSPGETRVIQVSPANYPPELVSARGFCQSSVSVIGECKSGQPCMKGS